jgi:hypothetical protein
MRIALATALVVLLTSSTAAARDLDIDPGLWKTIPRDSGPDMYYLVVRGDPTLPFLRAHYKPPMQTTVLGWQAPDTAKSSAQTLRWKWRAESFPAGGNECDSGKADPAAVVYATWKRGLKYYTLKYVWSSVGPKGSICDKKRNPFVAQDTVILESGGATDQWKAEEIDLKADFRRHFEDGNMSADVPDFYGLGVMSDGDQTHSESAADYAGFVVVY